MKDIYVNKEGVICDSETKAPFEDQKAIKDIIWEQLFPPFKELELKSDTFYQIEADWEIVECCAHDSCPVNAGCEHCKEPVKVARLKVPAPTVATDNRGESDKYTDEFPWLTETNEALLGATETLFEDNGKAEKGIVFLTKSGDIALTLSELKRLVNEIDDPASPVEEEQNELLDIVHELFSQACYQHEQGAEYGMYDHMCISTYEEAQSLLIKHNRIKKEECYRD